MQKSVPLSSLLALSLLSAGCLTLAPEETEESNQPSNGPDPDIGRIELVDGFEAQIGEKTLG